MADDTAGFSLDEARRRLADAIDRGDRRAEADVRARTAYIHTALGEPDKAVAEMTRARGIVQELGDEREEARLSYALGLLLERLPDRLDEALEVLDLGRFQASKLGERELEMKCRYQRIKIYERQQRYDEAIAELSLMILQLEDWGNHRGLVDAHRHRAAISLLAGLRARVIEDYRDAVAAARRHGDPALTLQVRLERRALVPSVTVPDLSIVPDEPLESWDELASEAIALGETGLAGHVELQRAAALLRGGPSEEGEALAEKARQHALASDAPLLYLMACLLLAEARDGRGDRPGVIAILLTCKVTLEQKLGPEAGRPVVQVLDSLPYRWGREAFSDALATYRRKAKEGPRT